MLERLAGNGELKKDLAAALGAGRLPHSVLLVGEAGCGTGFAARCLAADYLYPGGGPHAEAVLRGQDTECVTVRGEGASGQITVKRVREAREEIQHSALSDARGRVLFLYGAQNLNASSANALLKILEEPPQGVLFLLTASSAAHVLPTIRSRCSVYTVTPVPPEECAARLRAAEPAMSREEAAELSFLYEGHIGTCLRARRDPAARTALESAKKLCRYAAQGDTYRVLSLLTGVEKDREAAAALLWQATYLGSAALRRSGFDGMRPEVAARVIRAADSAREAMAANGNLRLLLTGFGLAVTQQ